MKEIRRLKAAGKPVKEIARDYNVHVMTIYKVINGNSWTSV